jgi:acetamidase/formamidase
MVNILNSVFEKEFSHTFQKAMIVAHNLSTQESSKEKGKNVEKSVRQTKQIITKSMEENETDATILLSLQADVHVFDYWSIVTNLVEKND